MMGKNLGDDLHEGKVTLPLLYLLNNAKDQDKLFLKNCIENPDTADIYAVVNLVKNSNALNYCHLIAQKYVDLAIANLAMFPDSEYKNAMIELANTSISRIS
jgi:octaprenyl-diphosphate synthase